ncbi:2-C-methyl-D-erythritol 2,4-cyclodiphosphate synthase [Candidatus Williamhamiltonella defendens]|uniref:2-C-methyl-D-erythritol 2,4-cyclodiphosphate synthase n=1 Tax=Candidatus Williamhamiltonella defendens TaxID=138072 RepID=UPI001650F277|nr:2-C-methyl-D-erythritol 2,4-cyclodiphosphate synthase [Candidatus Hamiltonella defensa]
MRIGKGFDVHKFGGAARLIIGGVYIPEKQGLIAHSDGDVVLHAVIDALLGAAALGDIGILFPDTSPDFKNADSRTLLRKSYEKILGKKYQLGNIDITIIAQEPKMAPYISEMRENMSKDLLCNIDHINIKATTTEKLGFIGRGEGIASEAVVLLIKK